MAQHDVGHCPLLDPIRAGGGVDLIRSSVEPVLQALIEAEATGMPVVERAATCSSRRLRGAYRSLATKWPSMPLQHPLARSSDEASSSTSERRPMTPCAPARRC